MKEITFINKTANSGEVYRSTPEERKRINERNREHRAKHRNVVVRVSSKPQSDVQSGPEAEDMSSRSALSSIATVDQTAIRTASTEASPTAKAAQLVCPLTGITIGGLGDPFDTFSIPMTAEDWRLIQFYKDVYYKRLWAAVTVVLSAAFSHLDLTRCPPDVVISECLRIPSRMWSLLASASCNLQHDTRVREKSLLLVNSGAASLRNDLQQSQVDRHSLLTSIHLHLAARSLKQDNVANAHLKGARAILRELVRQGVVIPPPTLGMFALVDRPIATRMLEGHTSSEEDE